MMMMGFKVKIRFIFVVMWVFLSLSVWAVDVSAPLQALKSKQYEKAFKQYQDLEKQGYQSGDMYQNMAVAALALGKDVDAIIYIEKALKFKPGNNDLSQLLSSVLKRNSKIESEETKSILVLYFNSFVGIFSVATWVLLSLLCFLAVGWFVYSGFPDQIKSRFYKSMLILSLSLFFIFSILSSYRNFQIHNHNTIIITADQAILKVSPDKESPDLSNLVPGSKVYYKDQINDWWYVSTVYGDEGWIKSVDGLRL